MTERETLFFGRSEIFVRFGLDRHKNPIPEGSYDFPIAAA